LFGGGSKEPEQKPIAGAEARATRTTTTTAEQQQERAKDPYALGDLLTLSEEELRARAATSRFMWSPWSWRRDVIPPLVDERTALVDRAMVLRGLAGEDELRALHAVGDEWLKHHDQRWVEHVVMQRSGEAAVEALRAEKAKRKEERRALAAQKREERRRAIDARKKTEIFFLGRGVSTALSDKQSRVAVLEDRGLPLLHNAQDVARDLGISISALRGLCFHSDATPRAHYVQFDVPKKTGGVRRLAAPKPQMARAQRWILENILTWMNIHDAAHGFVADRSTLTNAKPHEKQDIVINVDLENFFPSITFQRVRGIFEQVGYSGQVATILALLCTESPRHEVEHDGKKLWVAVGPRALPQGACTSPALSNRVCVRLDRRLTALAKRHGWTYTRYADDLTLSASGDACQQLARIKDGVNKIVADEGFKVHPKKQRVLRQSARQEVTGVVVNAGAHVPRTELRRLRAILHDANQFGLDIANREKRADFAAWLRGKIAYVQMIDPIKGQAMMEKLDEIESRT
jgi:RNA-directed DNA polymerase